MLHRHVNQNNNNRTHQYVCAEGQVFNNATQTCEPAATTGEQPSLDDMFCPPGQVFNNATQTCEPAATTEQPIVFRR